MTEGKKFYHHHGYLISKIMLELSFITQIECDENPPRAVSLNNFETTSFVIDLLKFIKSNKRNEDCIKTFA